MRRSAPLPTGERLRRHYRRKVVWFGLRDCQGLCDICKKLRDLVVEHQPTALWLCRECFCDQWENQA